VTTRLERGGSVIRHVLDTSAILAHYFDEPGADAVAAIWRSGSSLPGISAVTIPELRGRLNVEASEKDESLRAVDVYIQELTVCLLVDRATAEMAFQLRAATPERLPLVEALIAATARGVGAILVHRDPHFERIPRGLVEQPVLSAN
jgi:predicted nucleic acid-binding protein